MFNLEKRQKTWLDREDDDDIWNIKNTSSHISKRKYNILQFKTLGDDDNLVVLSEGGKQDHPKERFDIPKQWNWGHAVFQTHTHKMNSLLK